MSNPPDPGLVMRLATGYWESRCFLVANRLGVFESLGDGIRLPEALAEELGLAPRPARLLLNALVGLGLLERAGAGYRNGPAAATYLVPGSPAFLGNAVRYGDDMWDAWSALEEALRSDKPIVAPAEYTGADAERTRHFVRGMHGRALGIGSVLVGMLDLAGRSRLLDVGGGPGTYSALLTGANPGLRAVVLDLPAVVALAGEIVAELGASDRVAMLAGDYHETPFPDGMDVVLISGVLHRESEAGCRSLLERAHAALAPDGLLALADVFTDAGGGTPSFASLFGLNMLLSAPDGGVHADADVAAWMREVGFRAVECRPFPPPMPHRLVTGLR